MSNENYKYDVAISYAGEDHEYAEALADVLRTRRVKVFFDKYERAILWGEDLYTKLSDIYHKQAQYCIAFISKHYAAKVWTKHELRAAQARALSEQNAYLLPIRLDDTEVPGVLPTITYVDWDRETPETIADLVVEKLKRVSEVSSAFARKLSQEDVINFIDRATAQVVLILGRATHKRKILLDALQEELRKYNYVPIIFDFEKLVNRDITETISTLAHLARFVIADLTDAKSIPQELQAIVPHLPSVPILPLLHASDREYSIFEHFPRYPWVLPIHYYKDEASLLTSLKEKIIDTAEMKAKELVQQ